MKADHSSYRVAANRSLIGLGVQSAFAIAFLLHALYSGRDYLSATAAWFMGVGVLVWLALVVLYDQHRRERLEAMEAESLAAADAAAASAFEQGGDDLRVAARRLAVVQKWFLPAVSLVVGGLLVGLGIWRLQGGLELARPGSGLDPQNQGWAVSLGVAVAVVGFVFGRFISGMAKQRIWGTLRAGAAYAVGAAVFAGLVAAAHLGEMVLATDFLQRQMQVVLPVLMIALGAEVFLNFVLILYSPRKPGEAARAAFDLRSMGLLAAPDRIAESVGEALNYQFGVRVTETWFYQLVQRWWAGFAIFAVLLAWGLTGLVVLEPHQRGLVLAFGRPVREIGPGLHLKLPWPMSEVYVPTMAGPDGRVVRTATGLRRLDLGSPVPRADEPVILWTNDHTQNERFLLTQPGESDDGRGGNASWNAALVAVEVPMQYTVGDVRAFDLFATPEDKDELLRALGQRVVMHQILRMDVDEVLGAKRTDLSRRLERALRAEYTRRLGKYDETPEHFDGVKVEFVGAGGVHPPKDVADDFERVVQARQNREQMIEEAMQHRTRVLAEAAGSVELAQRIVAKLDEIASAQRAGTDEQGIEALRLEVQRMLEEAGGEAGSELLYAGAERWRRHMDERGAAVLYEGQLAAYAAAPELYRSSLYFDALKEAMQGTRLYLITGDPAKVTIRTDLQDRTSTIDVFDMSGEGER